MKIAIAQLNPTVGDLTGNADQILSAAQAAAAAGAHLLLTPELALCGYPPRDLLLNPSFIAATLAQLDHLAQALPPALTACVGSLEPNPEAAVRGEKPLFNSVALIAQGRVQHYCRKQLLPTYDVFDEDRYFQPGTCGNPVSLPAGSAPPQLLGITICEDLWNDEEFWGERRYGVNPLAELATAGVALTVNLSASPYSVGKQQVREAMLRHAARRYGQPLIYVNQVGGNDDLLFDGSSVAVNRAGEVVSRAPHCQTALLLVEFDPERGDLLPGPLAPPPAGEAAEIWAALVLGVQDYARKCGFRQAVLGLSGGIDSALVAAIAAEALGPEQVLGVLMPSPYSSDHSLSDAKALVTNLGIRSQVLAIAPAMTAYDEILAPLFTGTEFGVAEENIQSRIRGNLLMAIANKFGYLLLSTGNKSELAVGYCTLYGDMNGGLAAIADVPKTQVFALARWLNRERDVIPAHILTKPPSAELRPGQLDSDSLPPYDILDDILDRLLNQHQSVAEVIAAGHDPGAVARTAKLVHRAEFKRRQAPPGLKITDRAFGTGWRMPIACHPPEA